MPLTLLATLGWRNVWRHARRNLMLMAAIVVCVGTLIVGDALMRGMATGMEEIAIEQLTGHLKVLEPEYRDDPSVKHGFQPPAEIREALHDPEFHAWTERIGVPAVLQSERETRGVDLYGVDPADELRMSFVKEAEFDGRWLESRQDHGVVIGKDLARDLETGLGRRIVLMTEHVGGGTAEWGARVVGVFTSTSAGADEFFAFTGRDVLQRKIGADEITEVSVLLRDPQRLEADRKRLQSEVPAGLQVATWIMLRPLIAALAQFSKSTVGILAAVFVTALAFGLLNTLITAVLERTRELGLLQALGMRRSWIVMQVMIESGVIIVVGLLIGLGVGRLALWWLRDGIDVSAFGEGMKMMGGGNRIVPVLTGEDVMIVVVAVLVLGFLGALYPAWRAVRIEPLDALSGR